MPLWWIPLVSPGGLQRFGVGGCMITMSSTRRAAIQELKDEKYSLESQLQVAGLRESRFVSEKNKVEDDLKRVTANLAEERILWACDIGEKDRVLDHAKNVQEELERKAVTEAQKVQERYQALIVELESSNAKFKPDRLN
ncbi:hypothetical protein HanHA300_Chr03g0080701 [Helianthus annuus]|nr:hypothetical protein HanHA300_Chr03g0080701 [Helianthus annuus]KAJ0767113.1 hypothetical protein HanLR1_Chr03g0085371 [Helianthus annuus]